jgi:hypothetical protein
VTLRQRAARILTGAVILLAASVSVGLTAPDDGPFTIVVRPVFLRLDEALDDSRPRALGLDIDVKLGTMHLHFGWSAIPFASLSPVSTKPVSTLL